MSGAAGDSTVKLDPFVGQPLTAAAPAPAVMLQVHARRLQPVWQGDPHQRYGLRVDMSHCRRGGTSRCLVSSSAIAAASALIAWQRWLRAVTVRRGQRGTLRRERLICCNGVMGRAAWER
jgi:hypothetical protein